MKLNTLLQEVGLNPEKVFLLRHEDKRVRSGLYQVWKSAPKDFEGYQNIQKWKNRFPEGSHLAAFVVGPEDETLFVGLYDVLKLSQIDGELEWGAGKLAWRQKAREHNKIILEIRPKAKEEPFPPYVNFLRRLEDLRNIYPSWLTRLKERKGVSLLTFDDGMQYVGSATGEGGFWQRWQNYLVTGHGGNLILMHDQRDARNAMVSILELSGSAQTERDIINQEMLWQRKLGTRAKRLEKELP